MSNYFSKKQKGYGLLSVFNKVVACLQFDFSLVPLFRLRSLVIWFETTLYLVSGSELLYFYIDWFYCIVMEYYAKWREGKVMCDIILNLISEHFVLMNCFFLGTFSSLVLQFTFLFFQVKDSVTPGKSQFKAYWPLDQALTPAAQKLPLALGDFLCLPGNTPSPSAGSWGPLKKHFLIHSLLEAPVMWYYERCTHPHVPYLMQ